eukprot:GFUD01109392.1.p1 GENE.GFUD01109392.1~~GFUD01109392.1.p1  ORF type:complete len:158 (-),score=34.79 GFUD01109392.1:55-474(-)
MRPIPPYTWLVLSLISLTILNYNYAHCYTVVAQMMNTPHHPSPSLPGRIGKVGWPRPEMTDWSMVDKREIPPGQGRGGRCVRQGGICIFRDGIMGAAVRLNCCGEEKCVFYGSSFICTSNRYIKQEKNIHQASIMKDES